jgi:hypothetical protein
MRIQLSSIIRNNNMISVIPLSTVYPIYRNLFQFKLYQHNFLSGGGDFVTEE